MAGDKMAAISFDRLHRFTLLPPLFGFSLSPFQAYSSQYLPVLSKCYCKVFQWDDSKYVYINRGNTLGYILLNPCVAWSLHRLLVSRSNLNLSDDVCRAFAWESSFKHQKHQTNPVVLSEGRPRVSDFENSCCIVVTLHLRVRQSYCLFLCYSKILKSLTPTERSGSEGRTAPLELEGIHCVAEEHVSIDELSLWIEPKKNSQSLDNQVWLVTHFCLYFNQTCRGRCCFLNRFSDLQRCCISIHTAHMVSGKSGVLFYRCV